jgi:D-glycero-D-manno-heptose 1,7-bisphosphate phosphatase
MKPADPIVFLDRDGTINRESPDFVKQWGEFHFLPGSLAAIGSLTAAGFAVIVVTNQSGVGRGLIRKTALEDLHCRMRGAVATSGGRIDDIFFCPHQPNEGCRCRKPQPGMLLAACRKHGVPPSHTIMVGDRPTDILCARRAGCGLAVLLNAGREPLAVEELERLGVRADHVAPDLSAAAAWIRGNAAAAKRS